MEYQVLGALRVRREGVELAIDSAHKPRLVFAALLSRADRPVSVNWLTSVVWGDRAPASARRNVQHYVHRLRVVVGRSRIVSGPGGYTVVAGDGLDAARFRRLAAEGRSALDEGDHVAARHRLRAALELWHGPAYGEFADCPALAEEARRLEDLRVAVYEHWAEAELALGRHDAPVDELSDLVRVHPYRERLRGHLMRALYGAGRRADALRLFRDTWVLFTEQLGIEPGPQLRQLHEQMLRGEGTSCRGTSRYAGP